VGGTILIGIEFAACMVDDSADDGGWQGRPTIPLKEISRGRISPSPPRRAKLMVVSPAAGGSGGGG